MRFTNGHPAGRTTNAYDAWPFVELVSVGGPFAVLERNIILADTPGLDDINLLAESSVLSHLPRCTIVIIARKIDCILSTRSLQKMIRARCGCPVAVVATCSEVEDPSSVEKNELEQTEEVRRLNAQLKQCESELLCYAATSGHRPLIQLKKRLVQSLKAQSLLTNVTNKTRIRSCHGRSHLKMCSASPHTIISATSVDTRLMASPRSHSLRNGHKYLHWRNILFRSVRRFGLRNLFDM